MHTCVLLGNRIREGDPQAVAGGYARFYAPASYLGIFMMQRSLPTTDDAGTCLTNLTELYNQTAQQICEPGPRLFDEGVLHRSCQLDGLDCPTVCALAWLRGTCMLTVYRCSPNIHSRIIGAGCVS